jgi:hypothetical protein
MNPRIQLRNRWPGQLSPALSIAGLLLTVIVGCGPVSTQPSGQPTSGPTEPQAAPTTPIATATSEALLPAGWVAHSSSQTCGYAISYPSEIQVTDEGAYSQSFEFKQADPDEGARNFVYVSVIEPEIHRMIEQGAYDYEVYNYDPAVVEILLNMRVAESEVVSPVADMAPWFTYERKPDTPIGGHAAQTYENFQPWEFPSGTKEIRYYVSLNGCTYLIGGYPGTSNSDLPDAITEELFNQIVASIRLIP